MVIPIETRLQILLLYWDGWSLDEISEACGVFEETVCRWINRLNDIIANEGGATRH